MKKNLGTFFGLPRLGVGAVLLALCAFTPLSRADVTVINNLSQGGSGGVVATDGGTAWAQTFLSGSSGDITSLTLSLGTSSGSMAVWLYNAGNGSGPATGVDIGSVAAGTGIVTFNGNQLTDPLTSGNYYAIALIPLVSGANSITWNTTLSPTSGGSGTLQGSGEGLYYNTTSGYPDVDWELLTSSAFLQMDLEVVPEVPMTGVVMGFGVLAIALGRKLRPVVSSIA